MNPLHARSTARTRRLEEAGFTLIELMVVIIIIGLLATFAAPRVFQMLITAKSEIAKAELARVKEAVDQYYLKFNRWPESLQDIMSPPDDKPILEKDPIDPWGHPYEMKRVDGSDFDVISYGADGEPGGEGEAADVSYKENVNRKSDRGKE